MCLSIKFLFLQLFNVLGYFFVYKLFCLVCTTKIIKISIKGCCFNSTVWISRIYLILFRRKKSTYLLRYFRYCQCFFKNFFSLQLFFSTLLSVSIVHGGEAIGAHVIFRSICSIVFQKAALRDDWKLHMAA